MPNPVPRKRIDKDGTKIPVTIKTRDLLEKEKKKHHVELYDDLINFLYMFYLKFKNKATDEEIDELLEEGKK